jgi:hypothetical protein
MCTRSIPEPGRRQDAVRGFVFDVAVGKASDAV